ncbi:MAG: 50S ribosomal protein L15 [Candidatus Magasanikbacteria bacterium]|nr:50S ribosomal protein L15 [Candidatus Magasanikbacteria bacterium]
MSFGAHTIKAAVGSRHHSKRLGRGNASQKGTMSGRGGKGQTARSGGRRRTTLRTWRMSLLKIPKSRGFHSIYPKKEVVTLATLERVAKEGEAITPQSLHRLSVVDRPLSGVKIVATGKIFKALTVEGCLLTKTALAAIESAGGKVTF